MTSPLVKTKKSRYITDSHPQLFYITLQRFDVPRARFREAMQG